MEEQFRIGGVFYPAPKSFVSWLVAIFSNLVTGRHGPTGKGEKFALMGIAIQLTWVGDADDAKVEAS